MCFSHFFLYIYISFEGAVSYLTIGDLTGTEPPLFLVLMLFRMSASQPLTPSAKGAVAFVVEYHRKEQRFCCYKCSETAVDEPAERIDTVILIYATFRTFLKIIWLIYIRPELKLYFDQSATQI